MKQSLPKKYYFNIQSAIVSFLGLVNKTLEEREREGGGEIN